MKRLINGILIIVLMVTTFTLTSTFFIDTTSKEVSTAVVHQQLEKQVYKLVDTIQEIIPIQNDAAVETLIKRMEEDPEVSETIDKYAKQFVHDLAVAPDAITIDMNEEVQTLLLNYSNDLGDVMGDVINDKYKEVIIQEIVRRIDFNDYYKQGLGYVKDSMSPSQLSGVKLVNTVFENNETIRMMSLIVAVVTVVLMIIINIRKVWGFGTLGLGLILSGILHLIFKPIANPLIVRQISQLAGTLNYGVYTTFGLGFLIVGGLLMIVFLIFKPRFKS
ncbi:hypothetical protein G7062_05075 [Erysipelothrix sp. HDW6C]|uniref:hypothetical protein n=1 Tax=Erysipelothrix sp. HDW6C TaxID=2714930 RepID=UPI0014080481|nr:hypothetical protein [Erysipelothrix sp. HDW6C]QIK69705.1 hypothetical protein G7062_05075 [Erysipelothrix sp. HDW6C]